MVNQEIVEEVVGTVTQVVMETQVTDIIMVVVKVVELMQEIGRAHV